MSIQAISFNGLFSNFKKNIDSTKKSEESDLDLKTGDNSVTKNENIYSWRNTDKLLDENLEISPDSKQVTLNSVNRYLDGATYYYATEFDSEALLIKFSKKTVGTVPEPRKSEKYTSETYKISEDTAKGIKELVDKVDQDPENAKKLAEKFSEIKENLKSEQPIEKTQNIINTNGYSGDIDNIFPFIDIPITPIINPFYPTYINPMYYHQTIMSPFYMQQSPLLF